MAEKKPEKKTEKTIAEDVVEIVEDVVDVLKKARALQGGQGDKTNAFLEFVQKNEVKLPVEFERVSHLIERYVCKD